MSSADDEKQGPTGEVPPRMVKWSPPYRRENVEMPEFDLIEVERDGPVGRIVLKEPHHPWTPKHVH